MLGLVVTDTLFNGHPTLPEGHLAKLRAAVVQMGALAEVARDLQLGAYVRLGRGEEGTGGRDKPSILADTLEAVIGATYIDCGLDAASALVHRLFDPVIERAALLGAGLDWKTSLQELTAVHGLGVPEYVVKDSGPDHQKLFRAVVRVGSRELGSGEGHSKKAAEQLAAEAAWRAITAEAEVAPPAAESQLPGVELSPDEAEPSGRRADRVSRGRRRPRRTPSGQDGFRARTARGRDRPRGPGAPRRRPHGRERRRCSTRAPCAVTPRGRSASPPPWPAATSSAPNAGASTSGSPSTMLKRCSPTSA